MTTTADDVWRLLAELVTAQKETERRFQETDRILKEQSLETERILKEESLKTDRRFQGLIIGTGSFDPRRPRAGRSKQIM